MTQSNIPPAILAVLGKPGKYLFHGYWPFYFEIDSDKNVHQLTPTGERDGILSPDGWSSTPGTQNGIVSPVPESTFP